MDWTTVAIVLLAVAGTWMVITFAERAWWMAGKIAWHFVGRRRLQRRTEERLEVERKAMSVRLAQLRPTLTPGQRRTNGVSSSERTRGTPPEQRRS